MVFNYCWCVRLDFGFGVDVLNWDDKFIVFVVWILIFDCRGFVVEKLVCILNLKVLVKW